MSHFYFCPESPHHIEDDHGLTKYEQHYADDADQQVDRVCLAHCMNNLSQILSLKDHIYSERKYEDQKGSVKYRFFLCSHFLRFLKYIFYSIRLISIPDPCMSGCPDQNTIVHPLYHTPAFLHIINYENIAGIWRYLYETTAGYYRCQSLLS